MAEGLTRAEARAQREHELTTRRSAEAACALDFLVYGDGEAMAFPTSEGFRNVVPVTHAERCVFGARAACSRTYDPRPYAEAEPADVRMYEGTAIGALYALNGDGPERLELEGWELAPGTVFE
jgi:hypothetical protein